MRPLGTAVLVALLLLPAPPGAAQQGRADRTLELVETLADEGRLEEARTVLLDWWDRTSEAAAPGAMQHALWLRARLTVDPAIAAVDYARILDRFPEGELGAAAHLRLALLAEAQNDEAGASLHLRAILSEYPESPLRLEARDRLDRLDSGAGGGGGGRRGQGARGRQGGRQGRGRGGQAAAQPPQMPHAVQLGTFQTATQAVDLARDAIEAGFDARLVRIQGSELVRVRVGRFDDPAEAARLLARLRDAGFQPAAVQNAHLEIPIGGET